MEILKSEYNSLTEWKKAERQAYSWASSKGMLAKICETFGWKICRPAGYWTKERCIEDAKKYASTKEWNTGASRSAYTSARINGWLKECVFHMYGLRKPYGYWTKERCIEDANRYKTRFEWQTKSNSSYVIARCNNWLKECTTHMIEIKKPNGYWTKERCMKDARKYKTLKSWKLKCISAYNTAFKSGWLEECRSHMIELKKSNGYWTKKICIESAKKHALKSEWNLVSYAAYKAAYKNGWLEECTAHMIEIVKPDGYWTKERCIEDAKKYTSVKKWYTASGSAYNAARKNGCLKECKSHMTNVRQSPGYWTKERCMEYAKKYNTKQEWKQNFVSAYSTAHRNGWVEICCNHMKKK